MSKVYLAHVEVVERFVRNALYRAGFLTPSNLADVVQETFIKAFSKNARESYDGSREYAPFLLAIAKHALVDWLRRARRDVPFANDLDALLEGAQGSIAADEGQLFDFELVAAAARYVESLPPELKAVHERRFVAAEPQTRVAEEMGISRQNLRTLERRLVDGLRREIRRASLAPTLLPLPQTHGRSRS